MKKECFGELEKIKKCEDQKCPVRMFCLNTVLGKMVSDGLLEEYYIDGELGYKPTKKGMEKEKLVRRVWG